MLNFTRYVVGFAFSKDLQRIVLIRKNRPTWQCGSLNGPGGRIQAGESPHEAMIRKFYEEAGIIISKWIHYCTIRMHDCEIYFFSSIFNDLIDKVKTTTDEEIEVCSVSSLPPTILVNLNWLIPMSLYSSHNWNSIGMKTTVTPMYIISDDVKIDELEFHPYLVRT